MHLPIEARVTINLVMVLPQLGIFDVSPLFHTFHRRNMRWLDVTLKMFFPTRVLINHAYLIYCFKPCLGVKKVSSNDVIDVTFY
jgi:hypothetical protein